MPSSPVRYAIVGLGRAGWDIHIHQLRGRADAQIVAVVDPIEDRRNQASAEFGCKTYTSLTKMLKQHDVEVVVVATPSKDHAHDTIKSLRAAKAVVCEKPMAMTLAQADSMIKAAAQTAQHLIVHQNYRFFPEFLQLKEIVDSRIIGPVFYIKNTITSFSRRNDWQTLTKNGGGLLNNHGTHFIDQLLLLANGKVTALLSDLRQIASLGDVEDHLKVMFKFDNGVAADMEISTAENVAMPQPKWVIAGAHGTITVHGEKEIIVRHFDPAHLQPLQVVDGPAPDRKFGNTDQIPWQEQRIAIHPRPDDAFYSHVADIVRNNAPSKVDAASVREVMRLVAAIRKNTPFPGKPKPTAPAMS